jgi:hypothetical protein
MRKYHRQKKQTSRGCGPGHVQVPYLQSVNAKNRRFRVWKNAKFVDTLDCLTLKQATP